MNDCGILMSGSVTLDDLRKTAVSLLRGRGGANLTDSVTLSLLSQFDSACSKFAAVREGAPPSLVLRRLDTLSSLCRRFYFACATSRDADAVRLREAAAAILRFFSERRYPIDLAAPFYDDDLEFAYETAQEDGRGVICRKCVRSRPASVVDFDLSRERLTIT
jgi:hypothetical protein